MLIVNECRDLLDELDKTHAEQDAYICLVVSANQSSEELLSKIKTLGYMGFIQTTTLGEEVVITDKL
jgi:hypothetical protein